MLESERQQESIVLHEEARLLIWRTILQCNRFSSLPWMKWKCSPTLMLCSIRRWPPAHPQVSVSYANYSGIIDCSLQLTGQPPLRCVTRPRTPRTIQATNTSSRPVLRRRTRTIPCLIRRFRHSTRFPHWRSDRLFLVSLLCSTWDNRLL